MHTFVTSIRLALSLAAILAVGCSEPCEGEWDSPAPASWAGHEDLVPPGASLCGADANGAAMDFETDQNPFVKIVEHYEANGWERVAQDVSSNEMQSVSFVKGESRVHVLINVENGTYSRAILTLTE